MMIIGGRGGVGKPMGGVGRVFVDEVVAVVVVGGVGRAVDGGCKRWSFAILLTCMHHVVLSSLF